MLPYYCDVLTRPRKRSESITRQRQMQTALLQLWLRRNRLTRSRFCKSRTGTAEALRLRLHFRPKAEVRRGGGKETLQSSMKGLSCGDGASCLSRKYSCSVGRLPDRSPEGDGNQSVTRLEKLLLRQTRRRPRPRPQGQEPMRPRRQQKPSSPRRHGHRLSPRRLRRTLSNMGLYGRRRVYCSRSS